MHRLGFRNLGKLKRVHELVPERIAELIVVAAERQRDASLQIFRETEHAFRNESGENVRLFEMLIGRIDDEWDFSKRMMLEFLFEKRIAFFGIRESQPSDVFFFGIVVDIDMLTGEDAPFEVGVLDFVFAEWDRLGASDACAPDERCDEDSDANPYVRGRHALLILQKLDCREERGERGMDINSITEQIIGAD